MSVIQLPAIFDRPLQCSSRVSIDPDWPLTHTDFWQSNGGAARGHADRARPINLDIPVPEYNGDLLKIHLVGIFAMHANAEDEPAGMMGAALSLNQHNGQPFRVTLLAGMHYSDSSDLTEVHRINGDGTSIDTVGQAFIANRMHRVDRLTIDLKPFTRTAALRFKDLGSSASFILFDVICDYDQAVICPFSTRASGVSLQELGAIVRVGDRIRFQRAVAQLEQSVTKMSGEADEARGSILTFLAVVAAAKLELGAARKFHRFQLTAARALDKCSSTDELLLETQIQLQELAPDLLAATGVTEPIIARAISFIERSFARDLSDEEVAAQLGLSTSHFRYLFKLNTGQPFHQYILSLRLEKARHMLIENTVSVADVARLVGFGSPAHFSRAFMKRFHVPPSAIRIANR